MDLNDIIISYVREKISEKIEESEDFQAAKEQKNAAERDFVMSLTRKQRAAFHECIRKRDALAAVELAHFLEDCTLVVPGAPGRRPLRVHGRYSGGDAQPASGPLTPASA